MKKNFPLQTWMIIVTLVLALQGCSLPSAPYDVYVATNGNDSNDCRTQARACLTIQAGINKASTGSVIHVGAGTFPAGFLVNKLITIQGAGQTRTIVSQTRTDTFAISIGDTNWHAAITATLSDMTITGGYETLGTMANCHLIGNNLIISGARSVEVTVPHSGRIDLTNSTISGGSIGISNNSVFNGDHLMIQGSSLYGIVNNGVMSLQNTTVQQIAGGVAISNDTNRLSFTGGTITNNTGSGLINRAGATATITSTLVSRNHQSGLSNDGGTMIVEHVEAENNTYAGIASRAGSIQISRSASVNNVTGVQLEQTQASIVNSTISGNSGVGLVVEGSAVNLSFVTVAFNRSRGMAYGSSSVTMNNSIIELNSPNCFTLGAALSPDDGNLACNDALTNATLHLGALTLATGTKVIPLLSGSTAIDHATGTCPPVDQRGYARPHGSVCDIGAFEFGAALALEISTPETPTTIPTTLVIPSTATPVQSILEIATFTPTPVEPPTFILIKNAFCRKGPDTAFPDVTAIPKGDTVDILNISEDGFWYFVYWKKFNEKCWIGKSTGEPAGDISGLKVLTGPTLPAPEPPTPTKIPCNPLIKACP